MSDKMMLKKKFVTPKNMVSAVMMVQKQNEIMGKINANIKTVIKFRGDKK